MTKRHVAQHRAEFPLSGKVAALLAGASLSAAAVALTLAPQEARAQAVNGTPTVQFGADDAVRTATSDNFNVTADEALIDWAVTDNTVFLNAATSLNYSRDGGAYTVLNRVASSPLAGTLALNGAVTSDPQGKIWFYNPGGWVVGSGGVLNVGSLVLTSNPITVDMSDPIGQRFVGDKGEIRFGQAASGSSVTIQNGASITAANSDSYVALVAPRVVQAGAITSNGSTALIGAGAVDLTINTGLFDIVVTAATDDPNGVVHTGTTTGSSSTDGFHQQYLVAVPKNDALTMLVSGNLGYNSAFTATQDSDRIVLSAGSGLFSGQIDPTTSVAGGRIAITDANLTSNTEANATDAISVKADGPESFVDVGGNLALTAAKGGKGGVVTIDVANGGNLFVLGALDAHADGIGLIATDGDTLADVDGEAATGGAVKVTVGQGAFTVASSTNLSADAAGGIGGRSVGSAKGGEVTLDVGPDSQFQVEAFNDLTASANAFVQDSTVSVQPETGGMAKGGSVSLNFATGITANNISASASATAAGGSKQTSHDATGGVVSVGFTGGASSIGSLNFEIDTNAADGGVAHGGTASILVDNATLSASNFVRIDNNVDGNPGTVGSSSLAVRNGGTLTLGLGEGGSVYLYSRGSGNTAGTIESPAIAISVDNGSLIANQLYADAGSNGGFRSGGGSTRGGDVTFSIANGGDVDLNSLTLRSNAFGGSGDDAGDGTGGDVRLSLGNGTLDAASIELSAEGAAGSTFSSAGRTGTGFGGSALLELTDAGSQLTSSDITVRAPGTAFSGFGLAALDGPVLALSSAPGSGGNGKGGDAKVSIVAGSFTAGDLSIDATGTGGFGFNDLTTAANGVGGPGGDGEGGTAALAISGGSAAITSIELNAGGRGGEGASSGTVYDDNENQFFAPAGAGGNGTGGKATVDLTGGTLASTSITLDASGNLPDFRFFGTQYFGAGGYAYGDGATSGTGGIGEGGIAAFTIDGGALIDQGSDFGSLSVNVNAYGYGGNGGATGFAESSATAGDGALGKGGKASFSLLKGSSEAQFVGVGASGIGGVAGLGNFEGGGGEVFALGAAASAASLGGDGGDGEGGTATVTIGVDLGAFTSSDGERSFDLDASGIGGAAIGGRTAGNGGSATGGTATLNVIGGNVSLNSVYLYAAGYAASGADGGLDNTGGLGGNASGGTAQALASGTGTGLVLGNGITNASAFAGSGGTGGSGDFGLDVAGTGGNGGTAQGGTARLNASDGATLDYSQASEFELTVDGHGGDGRLGGNAQFTGGSAIGDGGNGGSGTGGTIDLSASDGTLLLGSAVFSAEGRGGSGGEALQYDGNSNDASNGGDAGEGFGGTINLSASGLAGSLQAVDLSLNAHGFGGDGASGRGYDPTTYAGANGGAGAGGTGGTIALDASGGGALQIAQPSFTSLTANGYAGVGGVGADGGSDPVTGNGGNGGAGGNSGQGNGGTVSWRAIGGSIAAGDLSIQVNGYGQDGAQGGFGAPGVVPTEGAPAGTDGAPGGVGQAGTGIGGTLLVTASNDEGGLAGGLDVGATSVDLRGFVGLESLGAAGAANIVTSVDESKGGVRFSSLSIDGTGDPFANPTTLTISSDGSPIHVAGDLIATTGGAIGITGTNAGGLDISGQLNLASDTTIALQSVGGALLRAGSIVLNANDTITIGASDCVGPLCPTVLADDFLTANAGNAFALAGPAQVGAGSELSVRAGTITGEAGSGYRAPSMSITASGDVTIRNASGGSLEAQAGLNFGEGQFYSDGSLTLGEAGGGGIFALDSLVGLAGTSIDVTPGASLAINGSLQLMAGDDVRIGAGASLVNNTGGSEPGSLVLDAGGLSSFATLPAGNVASLLIGDGATIDGTAGSVSLIGGAIDGGNAAFSGADFTADVRNPPALGVAQRDDNGQLTAPCLEGDICLGAISALGAVAIGQGEAAPIHFLGTGGIAGASVAISSQDTLTYGSAASPFTITASGPISLTSQSGDVALVGNALLDGGTVALSAAGPVTGNGRIRTAGDVGIDVGGSVSLDSLIAGGRLTSVAGIGGAFAPFTLPGDLTIGVLQVGADQSVQSNGSIAIGSASAGGNDLALEAAALVSLGGSSNIGDLSLSGATANFGTIAADGNIVLTATNAIAGTSATAGGALAASGASLTAQTLGSGATMALDISGPITLGSASSGAGLGVTGGDLSFAALASAGATTIATSSVSGGDIAAGTSLSISTPGAIVLGKATTGTTLSLDASTLTASTLQSGQAMSLRTTGAASLGTATSGANLDATTGDLSFTVLSSVGATTLNATKVAGGNITAGTSLAVTSAGAIGLGDASAGTTLTLDGATLSANALQSTQAMSVRSSGVANLGTATSGASLGVTTGDLAFTALTSTGATTVTASKVTGGTIAAGTSLAVTSPGAIGLTGATAVTNLSLDGAALAVTGLQAGQGLTLRSSGAATVGTAQAGTDLDIATGDLGFTALSSAGTTTVNATKVAGGDIAAGGAISVTSPGAIALGNTNAGTNLALNGASIAAATLQSGRATTLVASGASIISSATSGGDFSSTSGSVQFTAITATGDVLLDTASANGGDATSTTGAIALSSSGSATIGHLRGATDVSARATALTFAGISAGRDVSIDVTSLGGTAIAAGRDLTIRSVNDLVFGTIAAGRNLGVTASNGAITVNTDIDAGGTVALAGDAVLVKALGALNVASVSADNGDVAITTDGLLTVANATAIGDIGLTSTANSLVLGPLSAGRAPQTATAINAGGTSKGTPGAGAITLNAAQAITMQSTVDALTSLNATAGTVIDQRGLAVGKTIAYRSADIALEQSAALGQSNFTTGISLSNGGTSGAFLGDNAGGTGGYRLDNAEFARIHSGGDLMLAGGSSLSVGALAANAGTGSGGAVDGNIGANGALGLSSTGELAVAGALTLGNAGGNRLNLAGATVSVDAANGSVRLLEASGHGGTLAVIARDVLALSSAARSALVGLDAGAIDQRLAQNDGVADGRTLLEAGAITIGASGRVLIQNTAAGQTFDQRRGFVADSFTVSTTGTPLIAINGTVGGQTGLNALRAVQVTGTFDPLSTVNGCRLLTASCGTPQFDPIRGLIEEEIGEGSNLDGSDGGFGPGVLIQISRFEPVGFEAVIDEPVTGSGNDDFLAPEAGVGDGQCTAEDRTKCDKPPQRGGK